MRYFLWGSSQDSSAQSVLTHRSSELASFLLPLICRTLANPSFPNPIANASFTLRPQFPFLHHLHTRVPLRNTPLHSTSAHEPELCHPDRSSGVVCRCAVEGPRQPINPLTIRSAKSHFAFVSPLAPSIHFSYPSHSFFLLWKYLFPFDAAFPLALPLHC
jgi:hypothetical protein